VDHPDAVTYVTDQRQIGPYLTDESSAIHGHAERLYLPSNIGEIAAVLREANKNGVPVTISGAGTSITGARVPRGGWIISTERLRTAVYGSGLGRSISSGGATIAVDVEAMRARVPSGITLAELDLLLEPIGLFYPPDPTERGASIGGTIATNASGARSFRYGPTRNWIEALDLVLPDGTITSVRRGQRSRRGTIDVAGRSVRMPSRRAYRMPQCKNAAGYYLRRGMDTVDLFIGGEGTLSVVAAAEVRLLERPALAGTLLVFFAETSSLLQMAHAMRRAPFSAADVLSLEYFDSHSLELLRASYPDLPRADGALMIELSYRDPDDRLNGRDIVPDASVVAEWEAITRRFGAIQTRVVLPGERRRVVEFRHRLPERINEVARERYGKLGTDLAVPERKLAAMMKHYQEAAAAGVSTALFGHMGDCHLHMNFLPRTEKENAQAHRIHDRLARTAVRLGGTITAEHGAGKKHARTSAGETVPYAELLYGRMGMEAMRRVKHQLDRRQLLNPGTLLPGADL
jgi:D-lactate dehydrogenase (cytochrome)